MPERTENTPKSLGYSIQAEHPGIHNEIEGAIQTLKKLQKITTTLVPVDASANPGSSATINGTIEESSAEQEKDVKNGGPAGVKSAAPGTVPVLAAGDSFGRYQIARALGRGSMGAVYLAYDSQLQRYVALKTPFLGDSSNAIHRFYREARTTAQLRSPHICPTYDVGQISGIHFISMAFIDGRTLSHVIAEGLKDDRKAIIEITKKIARGLQKAHKHGIIHRDLKPDNIMVDKDGEPVVMDFGLARFLDDEVQITMAGRILGTPAYMSPEQAEGDGKNVGPQTDIYSLGVILYRMLTGRLPFSGSLASVLRQIATEEPRPPSSIDPEIGAGAPIERLCLKMMAKSKANRYRSMSEVLKALDELEPKAKPPAEKPSVFKRLTGWFQKRAAAPPKSEGSSASKRSSSSFSLGPSSGPSGVELEATQESASASAPSAGDFDVTQASAAASGSRDELEATQESVSSSHQEPIEASNTLEATTDSESNLPGRPHLTDATIAMTVQSQSTDR